MENAASSNLIALMSRSLRDISTFNSTREPGGKSTRSSASMALPIALDAAIRRLAVRDEQARLNAQMQRVTRSPPLGEAQQLSIRLRVPVGCIGMAQ
jgi:hypothetical protein